MSEHYEPSAHNEKQFSPEQREALQHDAAQDMGELATELVILAPEEGEPNAKQIVTEAKGEYDRQIENVIDAIADDVNQAAGYISGHVEDMVVQLRAGQRNLSDTEDMLRSVVRYAEEGSPDSLRRLLNDAGNTLQSALRQYVAAASESTSLHRYTAQKTEDTIEGAKQLRDTDTAFESFIVETEAQHPGEQALDGPFEGSRGAVVALHGASNSLEEVSLTFAQASRTGDEHAVDIRASLNVIDGLAAEAAAGRLNPDDVRRVVTKINDVYNDTVLQGAFGSVGEKINAVRQTVTRLAQ